VITTSSGHGFCSECESALQMRESESQVKRLAVWDFDYIFRIVSNGVIFYKLNKCTFFF
jgi:hypothetical protein